MSGSSARGSRRRPPHEVSKPWWRRIALLWYAGIGLSALVLFSVLVTLSARSGGSGAETPPLDAGTSLADFTLNDAVTGKAVSLDDYLGKQDVVIATLMGGF